MFLSSKTLCTYQALSNFCKVTASLLKWLSFNDKEVFSFRAMNSSKWLQWFHSFVEYSWLRKFERFDGFEDNWPILEFQPKNSHWFSVFSRCHVFVGTYLLVTFEQHQSSTTYLLEDRHKPEWSHSYQPLRTHQKKYKIIKKSTF